MSWAELIRLLDLGVRVSEWLATLSGLINDWIAACFKNPPADPTPEEKAAVLALLERSKVAQGSASADFVGAIEERLAKQS